VTYEDRIRPILIRMTRERIGWCAEQYEKSTASSESRKNSMDAIRQYVVELREMEGGKDADTQSSQ
jgi:hypothetical protein